MVDVVVKRPTQINIKTVQLMAKVRDEGNYTFLDEDGNTIHKIEEGYVPGFFPGPHYGDYLYLDIDLDTGTITNWRRPTAGQLAEILDKESD